MKEKELERGGEVSEDFGELIKYTASGFAGGLIIGALLDSFGFQKSAMGQWIVRTFSGEGESIFEGFYALRKRLRGHSASMAEAYGWGKLFGMVGPWIIDWGSRILGVDVYGVEGFYIPYFYALSDQIGANISGFIYLKRNTNSFRKTTQQYFHHPVMLVSLLIVLIVPLGLLAARILGFSPTTQVFAALETIAANLCWLPPLVGWLNEKKGSQKHS
jgi:hypothetical protein